MQMIRHHFFAYLPILVLVSIFLDLSRADDGDKWNCPLNASSPFSYVVMIWDQHKYASFTSDGVNGSATMGSLITCNAVLTTAYYYVNKVLNDKYTFDRLNQWSRFRVIGQYIYVRDARGRTHPCYQNLSVTNIQPHPKSKVKGVRILFDFAVVVLPSPYNVISPTFPTMFFPTSTLDLIQSIRYVNIIQSETYCSTPAPETLDVRDWIFNERVDVHTKPFHTQCIRYLCEQKVPGRGSEGRPECERILNERMNATMLCMAPSYYRIQAIKPNPDRTLWPNPLAGTPLVCNGSVLGMSNFVKTRARDFYSEYQQDFYFYVTLLRVLPWLIDRIKEHTPEIKPFYIEDQGLRRRDITEPWRLTTEDWGFNSFWTLPFGDRPFLQPTFFPYSLAPATFCCSIFSKTLFSSLTLHIWRAL